MAVDEGNVRRRGSPVRRLSFGELITQDCDDGKDQCRHRKRAIRMFFLGPPMLLLVN